MDAHPVLRSVAILTVSVAVLGLVACGSSKNEPDPARSPEKDTGSASPSSTSAPATGTYRGHGISFGYPADWHEFYLSDSRVDVNPAYAPDLPGREDEVVMVFVSHDAPVKAPADLTPEAALTRFFPGQVTGPVQTTSAGALPAYSAPLTTTGPHGQALEGVGVFIEGTAGDFVMLCQYEPESKDVVMSGCAMVRETFAEVPVGVMGGPKTCTAGEMALFNELGLPEGAMPEEPERVSAPPGHGEKQCGVLVDMPARSTRDVIGFFRSRFAEGGWEITWGPKVAREFAPGQPVVSMVAERDFDSVLIEVYMRGEVVNHFFVTAGDG